jgi:predicted regulator of Ras-like GTPase activity (Roadblock/LC7/MglB family)
MAGWKIKNLFWISDEDESEETEPTPTEAAREVELPPVPSARGAVGTIDRILAGLSDVDGVVGGLAISPEGTVLGCMPPRLYDEETLDRLGARIAQLRAALISDAEGANAPKGGVVRFRQHQLYLNPIASGIVGVLADNRVNVPALTMALRVVAQQLDARSLPPSARP